MFCTVKEILRINSKFQSRNVRDDGDRAINALISSINSVAVMVTKAPFGYKG